MRGETPTSRSRRGAAEEEAAPRARKPAPARAGAKPAARKTAAATAKPAARKPAAAPPKPVKAAAAKPARAVKAAAAPAARKPAARKTAAASPPARPAAKAAPAARTKAAATGAARGTARAAAGEAAPPTRKRTVAAGPDAAPRTRRRRGPPATPERIEELVAAVRASLEDDKAEEIVILDVADRASFTDRMIIATGQVERQIDAMATHLVEALQKLGLVLRRDRIQSSPDWVLIDAGDLVIHLFRPEARQTYALERMWGPESPRAEGTP